MQWRRPRDRGPATRISRARLEPNWVAYPTGGSPWLRPEIFAHPATRSDICHDCGLQWAHTSNGGWLMGSVDLWRRKAEACLEKAHVVSDRQRARLLIVQAHNYLKAAEETEAQQLSARRAAETQLAV